MRTKTVLRYYCDHCSKGGFKKPDMASHEATCTLNPSRGCYLCGHLSITPDIPALISEMRKHADVYSNDDGTYEVKTNQPINWLYSKVDGCPACILSVLRQGKIFAFEVFDYKEAVAEWHREQTVEKYGALNQQF